MKKTILGGSLILAFFSIAISSCNKDKTTAVTTISQTDSVVVNYSPSESYTFFRFRDSSVIANSDSASTNWDFGLKYTTFILNSYAYGPGNAGVILQNAIYSSVTVAPDAGYAYDTTASQKAIKDGSWYNYDVVTHSFSPKAGQTFVFRTSDNHYVKMELLSVGYILGPVPGTPPIKLIYRFRYTYQSNGTKNF